MALEISQQLGFLTHTRHNTSEGVSRRSDMMQWSDDVNLQFTASSEARPRQSTEEEKRCLVGQFSNYTEEK